ncbi:hypothetical protein LCGC14_2071760, partial [marine sediment metagenome]
MGEFTKPRENEPVFPVKGNSGFYGSEGQPTSTALQLSATAHLELPLREKQLEDIGNAEKPLQVDESIRSKAHLVCDKRPAGNYKYDFRGRREHDWLDGRNPESVSAQRAVPVALSRTDTSEQQVLRNVENAVHNSPGRELDAGATTDATSDLYCFGSGVKTCKTCHPGRPCERDDGGLPKTCRPCRESVQAAREHTPGFQREFNRLNSDPVGFRRRSRDGTGGRGSGREDAPLEDWVLRQLHD